MAAAACSSRPEPKAILEAIHRYRVNFFRRCPRCTSACSIHPELEKFDISSIQGCFSGAAPMPVEVIKAFEERTKSQICEGYGLSETSPVVTINPWGGTTKVGSIGLRYPIRR
jgi:long-chain acyl-CoA synthetase